MDSAGIVLFEPLIEVFADYTIGDIVDRWVVLPLKLLLLFLGLLLFACFSEVVVLVELQEALGADFGVLFGEAGEDLRFEGAFLHFLFLSLEEVFSNSDHLPFVACGVVQL